MKPIRPLLCYSLAAFAAALLAGCGGSSSSSPKADDKPAPTREPAFKVKGVDLAREFEDDPKAATAKYKEKVIEIDGVVDEPGTDAEPSTFLVGYHDDTKKGFGFKVFCRYRPADRQKADALSSGQKVKVKGVCYGGDSILITCTDCELLEVGPDTAVAVSAADLAKEFADDLEAAKKKYAAKQLIVEGVIAEMGKEKGTGVLFVHLEGAKNKEGKPILVTTGYGDAQKDAFAKYKKGDKIKFKAKFFDGFGDTVSLRDAVLAK